jgi:predicted GIY-YIG superfamily endonuclease
MLPQARLGLGQHEMFTPDRCWLDWTVVVQGCRLNGCMQKAQQLLFPDPQPLVERLGREFFRQAPESPGVYLMRDATDAVLYVGKAKNLRKRLGSYRVANPDRMPRRHLRMLCAVVRIELQECLDESSAFARESELLRTLRPKFNRAGTWRPPPRFLAWRCIEQQLQLAVTEAPDASWRLHGPLGAGAVALHSALARLLWIAVHPELGFAALPFGWAHGQREKEAVLHCGLMIELIASNLEKLLTGQATAFSDWIRWRLPGNLHPFEKSSMEADLEIINDAFPEEVDPRDSSIQ